MNCPSASKSGPWSEILFLGSGMIIFVPLLLMLVMAFTGSNVAGIAIK
jgi:hypothetical protein